MPKLGPLVESSTYPIQIPPAAAAGLDTEVEPPRETLHRRLPAYGLRFDTMGLNHCLEIKTRDHDLRPSPCTNPSSGVPYLLPLGPEDDAGPIGFPSKNDKKGNSQSCSPGCNWRIAQAMWSLRCLMPRQAARFPSL